MSFNLNGLDYAGTEVNVLRSGGDEGGDGAGGLGEIRQICIQVSFCIPFCYPVEFILNKTYHFNIKK